MKQLFFSIVWFVLTAPLLAGAQAGEADRPTGPGAGTPTPTGPGAGTPVPTGPGAGTPVPSGSGGGRISIFNPLEGGGITSIVGFFQAILDVLMIFAVPLVVFFIIYAGFNYVTARGNTEKIKQAHNALLYAIIGGLLILGANVILEIVANTVCEITGDTITSVCD